ncbi:MAG: hypothetical protein ACRETA_02095 [Gammaproteobacteria bacterium]
MQRISSRTTHFQKRVFPAIWFTIIAFVVVVVMIAIVVNHRFQPLLFAVFLLFALCMAIFGHLIMKKLAANLMDEVWDDGNALVVRNRGVEARIQLSTIMDIEPQAYSHPPRVTLTLREPSAFGTKIAFCPIGISYFPFYGNRVVNDLMKRVSTLQNG